MKKLYALLMAFVLSLVACKGETVGASVSNNFIGPPGDAGTIPVSNGPGQPAGWQSNTGGTWLTILDLDLTAQGSQTFATDTTYTIAGMTWTKGNSANEATHASLSTSGLNFQPASTSDYNGGTRTMPYLWLPLSQLASLPASFDWDSGVRVYVSYSHNCAASYDDVVLAIDHNDLTTFGFVAGFGFTTAGAGDAISINYNSTNNGFSTKSQSLVSPSSLMLELPSGLMGAMVNTYNDGPYDAGWPSPPTLVAGPRTMYNSVSASITAYAGNSLASSWGIFLGAHRAGSSTSLSVTFTRLRVDTHS